MDTVSIPGPPCPICGGSAFHRGEEDEQLVEIGDARYLPRACAECGNVQLVLTRAEELDTCLSNF
jgi:hypothetical protein